MIQRSTAFQHLARIGLRLALCAAVASLAACGGGDAADGDAADDAQASQSAPLGSEALALTPVLLDYCGVNSQPQIAKPGVSGMNYSPMATWNNHGYLETSGFVYAWGQAETSTFGPLKLETEFRSYVGSMGHTLVSSGLASGPSMGVLISDALPDQAVACVRSVAHPVMSGSWANGEAPVVQAVQWSGRATAALPMSGIDGEVHNGFEFVANFAVPADQGGVYFRVSKADVAEPASARICQLTQGQAQWSCQRPDVQDLGDGWALILRGVEPGVYVLA